MSEKSHRKIIDDVYKTTKDKGIEIKKTDIARDFNSNGMIFNSYWNSFMNSFDADVVLNDRVWELGEIGRDTA